MQWIEVVSLDLSRKECIILSSSAIFNALLHQEDHKKLANFSGLFGSFSLADKSTSRTEFVYWTFVKEDSLGLPFDILRVIVCTRWAGRGPQKKKKWCKRCRKQENIAIVVVNDDSQHWQIRDLMVPQAHLGDQCRCWEGLTNYILHVVLV